jgi:hypothetical protein
MGISEERRLLCTCLKSKHDPRLCRLNTSSTLLTLKLGRQSYSFYGLAVVFLPSGITKREIIILSFSMQLRAISCSNGMACCITTRQQESVTFLPVISEFDLKERCRINVTLFSCSKASEKS